MALAAAALGFSCAFSRVSLYRHRPLVFCISKVGSSSSSCAVGVESSGFVEEKRTENAGRLIGEDGDSRAPRWKKLSSVELGIRSSMISKPTRVVLNALKKKGYEVYLVGGCVRDLILKRTPKDFDIITSAELKQVRNTFSRCEVIGRRFPICHVHVDETVIEVSSFSTSGRNSFGGLRNNVKRPPGCCERDYVRWKNCLKRDFTVNGLFFDPYAKIIYDYVGGMEDIKKAKVRTVIPANLSFVEDCARILRAFRVASRLGFRFTREIALSLRVLSRSVLRLDKGRILMEVNYMLSFGSGEASLRLLWRFGLLELLLPFQASYFVSQRFKRRDKGSNLLLSLFASLDKVVAPDRPCHSSLWLTILAFHKALVDKPRDPLVVAAFSLALHSGGSLLEAIEIARGINQPHDSSYLELRESPVLHSKLAMRDEVIDLAASIKDVLFKITCARYVSQAMSMYPQAPRTDLVFIPEALLQKACRIFDCVRRGMERGTVPRQLKIDYDSLSSGSLQEVRRTLARIVFDTVYPKERQERS
ncbi:uncharacterized protein LOC115664919 isoform X2 [Syzygium oleosum]|uniref:uncharacterized protein LOC115664919 isoform X2 n=1 Tax=Syzygium oleosum TaxID=219896 RepID=UPI0011D22B88|nr:uncharacterized protein LOC115664919 isoform X2 [Syzygium oleosum]